ncbi:MAG: SDR family oxidoreductase [Bacillota bacterium]
MARYEDLKGKRVLVTGAARGIGLATAKRFADEGAKVVILDLDQEALDQALAENPAFWGGISADVSDPESVKNAFQKNDEILGSIDVLIANAGISIRKPFLEITAEQWSKVIGVNLNGIFLCASQAAIRMDAQGSGVILMTASTNGTEGHPYYADYNSSKAGVILLAKTMALELAPKIRVNAVCPGYVLTEMQKGEYTEEMLEAVNEEIPIKRHADPKEIGALFAYLASSEASYITGADVRIDGGETAGLP